MGGMLLYVLVVLQLIPGNRGSAGDGAIVDTSLGKVRGYMMTSRSGRQFYAFSGLPYARPPLGSLRFEPPEPAASWSGVRNATEDGPFCMQENIYEINPQVVGVEDCLYLSLYTHNISGRAPVIVYFHGGAFTFGNGARVKSPEYFMDEDVVIVEVNFRLGILGFLSFEDGVMPGNQGMKDQVMALRWIQEHIDRFGGDPGRVTVMGESAGGASAYHHTVSPLSRGLFHRAISESSTSYNVGSLMPPGYVKQLSLRLAAMTNCARRTTREIVACFKAMNASDLVKQILKYREFQLDPVILFRVVFESGPGAFITFPIKDWKHAPVPLLTGTTAAEGIVRTKYFLYYNMDWECYTKNFNTIAPLSLGYFAAASNPDSVTRQVRQFYLPEKHITLKNWPQLVQMYSDGVYTIDEIRGADQHPGDVYFYYFDYLGEYTFTENISRTLVIGAAHIDEMIYLWRYKNKFGNLTGQDLDLSKKLVKLWTNFAKYGTPTGGDSEFQWETWRPDQHRYLHISKDGFNMETGLAEDRYSFWNSIKYRDNLEKNNSIIRLYPQTLFNCSSQNSLGMSNILNSFLNEIDQLQKILSSDDDSRF